MNSELGGGEEGDHVRRKGTGGAYLLCAFTYFSLFFFSLHSGNMGHGEGAYIGPGRGGQMEGRKRGFVVYVI